MHWLTCELEYVEGNDRLIVPPGCRVELFNQKLDGAKFDRAEVEAVLSCAARQNSELLGQKRDKPAVVVCVIHGHLRTLLRRWLTDKPPEHERIPTLKLNVGPISPTKATPQAADQPSLF